MTEMSKLKTGLKTAECTGYPYSLCPPTKRTVTDPNPGHLNGRYHTAAWRYVISYL